MAEYIEGRTPLLIFLDGTWREARKMFRSPWLESLPVIAVEPEALSEYRLRVAVRDHQLGTAEVAIPLLERLGYPEAARRLRAYFDIFRENYLAGRSNKFPANEKSDSAPSSEN